MGRKSPGSSAGRSAGISGGRFKAELRRKRGQEQSRDRINEIGDQRRGGVYRTDVKFAEPEPGRKLPPRGPERDELARHVAESRSAGEALLPIATRLGFNVSQVTSLCKQYGITAQKAVQADD